MSACFLRNKTFLHTELDIIQFFLFLSSEQCKEMIFKWDFFRLPCVLVLSLALSFAHYLRLTFHMCYIFFIVIATFSQYSAATIASTYVYFWSIFFLQFLFWGRRLQTTIFLFGGWCCCCCCCCCVLLRVSHVWIFSSLHLSVYFHT